MRGNSALNKWDLALFLAMESSFASVERWTTSRIFSPFPVLEKRRWLPRRTEPRAAESGDKIVLAGSRRKRAWERAAPLRVPSKRGRFERPFLRFTDSIFMLLFFSYIPDRYAWVDNEIALAHRISRTTSPRYTFDLTIERARFAYFLLRLPRLWRGAFTFTSAESTGPHPRGIGTVVFTCVPPCAPSFAMISDPWNFWTVVHATRILVYSYLYPYIDFESVFRSFSLSFRLSLRDCRLVRTSEDLKRSCSCRADTFFKTWSSTLLLSECRYPIDPIRLIDDYKTRGSFSPRTEYRLFTFARIKSRSNSSMTERTIANDSETAIKWFALKLRGAK